MKKKQKIFAIYIFLIFIGGVTGFLYWRFFGCAANTCPLKSNLYFMIFQGGLLGFLLGNLVTNFFSNKNHNDENVSS